MARYEDLTVTNLTVAGTLNKSAFDNVNVTADFAVATDKFAVTAASGNTVIAGTLAVAGASTLTGATGITGNLAVNTDKFTVTAASGNTVVAGTLGVTGHATFASLVELQQVAVAGLPAAAAGNLGCVVYCTNGDAGSPCLAVSNGTNWLRVALGTAVSAT